MKMSSFLKKNQLTLILLMATIFVQISCGAVCDLKTLLMEIKQDLADNRILDCLREIDPLHITDETEEQRNLRLAAQWDTSCAFEASDKWMDKIMKNFGISSLVDSVGDRVSKDFDNQADLCEIVRAAIGKNLFDIENLNIQDLNLDDDKSMKFLNMIDCPGAGDNRLEGPRICAATSGSYFQKEGWNIFIGTNNIKFLGSPTFNLANPKDEAFDPTKKLNANVLLPGAQQALKFSMKQFENKQAELAELIDKYSGGDVVENKDNKINMDNKEVEQKSDSGLVYVHVKRLEAIVNDSNTLYFNKVPAKQNFAYPSASFDLATDKTGIVFAFYMISYDLKSDKKKSRFQMSFNNSVVKETKQSAATKTACLTGGFAERQPIKQTQLSVAYSSLEDGSVSESKQQAFVFGSIKLPDGPVLKSYIKDTQILHKNLKYGDILNLNLDIRSDSVENTIYIILYTVNIPITSSNSKTEFGIRLRYANKALSETAFVSKGVTEYSAHCAYAVETTKGINHASLEYRYNGDQTLDATIKGDSVFSMSAFALPKTAQLENCNLASKIALYDGQWRDFGFKKQITIPSGRTKSAVLVLYHVNLEVYGREFSVSLSINGKTFKNNISTSNHTERASIQGYAVHLLAAGIYTFDLKYYIHPKTATATDEKLSQQKIEYDPSDKHADESVFMQVILLE